MVGLILLKKKNKKKGKKPTTRTTTETEKNCLSLAKLFSYTTGSFPVATLKECPGGVASPLQGKHAMAPTGDTCEQCERKSVRLP